MGKFAKADEDRQKELKLAKTEFEKLYRNFLAKHPQAEEVPRELPGPPLVRIKNCSRQPLKVLMAGTQNEVNLQPEQYGDLHLQHEVHCAHFNAKLTRAKLWILA